ncbi:hypothetical protein EJ04DRAFT_531088 [Polyplosphaeria fusca]|uniref:Uncharacterized protein n=1 Tax=Polyplosphaeria fusca TaxID=682080 RepID=A0A9P4RBX6_9PLEO|nr:hypothetical protein EJ04DRAFT_531088 [Polyplosphaeria fusca]
MSSAASYPPFTPVDTAPPKHLVKDEVESPSISSTNALARFEFEAGHGREGTKILMVEWEDDDTTRGIRGDWHISWESKTTVLPADDQPNNDVNRIYFLLPPGVAVPSSVTLTHQPKDTSKAVVVWHTNPLPAIFPPELGASARAAGKKGILHTIWAKKRLQVLQKEIEVESKSNVEGIGFLMAVQEKEWIEQTFGVTAKPIGLNLSLAEPTVAPLGPASPRSPGGGRLMEKLRGLKLGTSDKDLSSKSEPGDMLHSNPLSPESSDVAVSSFAAFKGANPSVLAAKPPQPPQPASRKVAAHSPPPSLVAQQQEFSGMASLNAFTAPASTPAFESRGTPLPDDDKNDGLFALPISPRSPETSKSPFSFTANETSKYLKGESAAESTPTLTHDCRFSFPTSHFLHFSTAPTLARTMAYVPSGRGAVMQLRYGGDDEAAPEIQKLLAAVYENEDSYEAWDKLALDLPTLHGGSITRNSNPEVIQFARNVYDTLLAKFPLFYGYWKTYAGMEFAIGGTDTAEMVYERGVSCISNSVDLWTAYCGFKMDMYHDQDVIRPLFEYAAEQVGMDFQGFPFWEKYIEFELKYDRPANVSKILMRTVGLPLYQYAQIYRKLQTAIQTRPLTDFESPDRLVEMANDIRSRATHAGTPNLPDTEIDRIIRLDLEKYYYEIHSNVGVEVRDRWAFESSLKRSYFTVDDVTEEELDMWRKYLDFEEKRKNYVHTKFLYERCVVVCASYPEFWLRYARWMSAQPGKAEDARNIYARACTIFAPIAEPSIRLHWARFEEKMGRYLLARDIHMSILDILPTHVETMLSLANLDRRWIGIDAALYILDDLAKQRTSDIGGQLAAEQARILYQCQGSPDAARQVFNAKFPLCKDSEAFWLAWLDFEINQHNSAETPDAAHLRIKAPYMEYLLQQGGQGMAKEYVQMDMMINGYVCSTAGLRLSLPPLPNPLQIMSPSRGDLTTPAACLTTAILDFLSRLDHFSSCKHIDLSGLPSSTSTTCPNSHLAPITTLFTASTMISS